ncbi:sensor histidine kinase [Phenylobacterium sp.]|uniref:sensor histidine kinase n=1 Tax=Phenylobacterium sp. TaxID=1871053 RepID=UPI002E34CA71|nr:histidine kinase dimerization/phosphoacceptor domain -containing protein [Phenylobacterium sp.]HEX4710676.1 histidine kinase dimerization/phosphoacceptor domain -containing protein [Phenylobacterium sp.]
MGDFGTSADHDAPARRGGEFMERELRYRTLFEGVSEGFAMVEALRDANGRPVDYVVLEANPALHRILGQEKPLVGRRQSEIMSASPPALLQSLMQACETALKGHPLHFEYHHPGGTRWFDIHLSQVGPDRLAQLVVDITERKRAEARQSEMFDELNHRVKNNLAVVSAMLAMQSRVARTPEVRDHLARAVDRIHTIADVHASLYRSGRKDEVDFSTYLHDLCGRLGESVVDKARVRLTVEAEPSVLSLDKAVALGVVVNELITNAAKHAYATPAVGTISVKLAREGAGLRLHVEDSGPGLPEKPNPAGLGMRLVRSLVQQLGATLEIDCKGGAAFTVRLPNTGAAEPAPDSQARLL